MWIIQRLMTRLRVSANSIVVWCWPVDLVVPGSNPLQVIKFLLLSLLIWKGVFKILQNDTWDLLKKAYGTSKKLRFQFRGQLNKPFSEPTYLYTNLNKMSTCAVLVYLSVVHSLFFFKWMNFFDVVHLLKSRVGFVKVNLDNLKINLNSLKSFIVRKSAPCRAVCPCTSIFTIYSVKMMARWFLCSFPSILLHCSSVCSST